jgi:glucose-1-phosphate thymidylyltransferase
MGRGAEVERTDAVILAGGFAKRMWPLTKDRPKQLLPVAGRPMLSYTLEGLLGTPGMDRIFISTNEAFSDQFRTFLGGYYGQGVELFIEPSPSEDRKLGAIGGLGHLISEKDLQDETMIVGGDNLFEFPFSAPIKAFQDRGIDLVAVHDVGSKERARLYGIVEMAEDGTISNFMEKPEVPPTTLAATALYLFKSGTVRSVNDYLEGGGKSDALGFFISYLIGTRKVLAWKGPGRWFDIGSLEVYREADSYFSLRTERSAPMV